MNAPEFWNEKNRTRGPRRRRRFAVSGRKRRSQLKLWTPAKTSRGIRRRWRRRKVCTLSCKCFERANHESIALEALLSTLRAHLTRLTAELSDHSRLLQELRTLRDSDVRALKEKSHEISQLRQEVERLAGEVEVLRGVVEEGLKERKEAREQSMERSRSPSQSHSSSLVEVEVEVKELRETGQQGKQEEEHLADDETDSEDEVSDGRSTPSPSHSPRRRAPRPSDRTDLATLGSSPPSAGTSKQPWLDSVEVTRISEEVSERRYERSGSASAIVGVEPSFAAGRARGYHTDSNGSDDEVPPSRPRSRGSDISNRSATKDARRAPSPVRRPSAPNPTSLYSRDPTSAPRPTSPESRPSQAPATSNTTAAPPATTSAEAPFPQIRGEYLEKLFFSAPDHNADTCTVCNRRARAAAARQQRKVATWSAGCRPYLEAEDEGFAEGVEEAHAKKGKQRTDEDRLPPQTVLTKVLRELEDDFTHYKGYVFGVFGFASDSQLCMAGSISSWRTSTRSSTPCQTLQNVTSSQNICGRLSMSWNRR